MNSNFSPLALKALIDVITGGSGSSVEPPIGVYRSASMLENFFMECGIEFRVDGSRLASVRDALRRERNREPDGNALTRIAEHVADPRHYLASPAKGKAVVEHLNAAFATEGMEVTIIDGKARLRNRASGGAILTTFAAKTEFLDFETVSRDFERAIENAESDPEDAVTAACSTLEAVCRSILVELELPLPRKRDLGGLARAVQDPLDLSPSRTDLPAEVANDVRQVLGGLTTAIQGIGALRTHGGDAHGRERGRKPVDARIARLSIHASSTVALFLIETWERKQRRTLTHREDPARPG